MKPFLIVITAFFGLLIQGNAQKISGAVLDADGTPLQNASVALLNQKDTSVVKLAVADLKGTYVFDGFAPGKYLIRANFVGYERGYSNHFEITTTDVTVEPIVLQKTTTQLTGVTVTARRPLVEVKADKMVVNVEGTVNATGNDGIELLRRSPGVMVDKDDNISLAGKSGTVIYIDGKPSPLRGADLAAFLRSLQSSSVESIEIITNPSAKYDAAGNAGIINIKLKKDKSLGTNGSVNAGYNQGFYPKFNGGFSLNHRNKNVNLYGNYNFYDGKNHTEQAIFRAQGDSTFDQNGVMTLNRTSHNFKAGADFFVSRKSTVGIMANGTLAENGFNNRGPMEIAYKPTGVVDRILLTSTDMKGKRNNVNFNANYRYADTSGRELNLDADYGFYKNSSEQFLPNIYYKADGTTELYRNVYRMIAPTNIDLFAFKADYEQKLGKGKIGFGGKSGYVKTANDFRRYDVINNTDVLDQSRSNQFNYKEYVNALYATYNRAFKGYAIQLGLRAENTNSDGRSVNEFLNYDETLHRNYTDLFPTASVTFNKNPMNQFTVAYGRRIDRPSYENLNPFEFKLNDYLYMRGNTELKPQYTNSFSITNVFKYKLTTKLDYSHVKNMFAQVIDTTEGSKAFQTTRNLASQDVVSLNVSYPFMYKQFMSFSNLTGNYSKYKADFGDGRTVDLDNFGLQYFVQNTQKFGKKKDWTAELTGLYISPFVWQGMFKGKSMGGVDLGLQKNILAGKGTLKTSVTDIFNTMRFRGESDYGGAYNNVLAKWESRQFKVNFTYRFGSAQIKAARQRKTAAEDERTRTSGGSSTPGQ
ncbi:MAG: TonB-dependent receptor [Niabella sp. SCN 42-15]|nr:MAG: TonB-dependent receptor [Niabella sp. SCN 42-15]